MGSVEDHRRLVEEFWRTVYEKRDYDAVGRFFASDGWYEDVPTPDTGAIGPEAVPKRLRIGHEPVERFEHEWLERIRSFGTAGRKDPA